MESEGIGKGEGEKTSREAFQSMSSFPQFPIASLMSPFFSVFYSPLHFVRLYHSCQHQILPFCHSVSHKPPRSLTLCTVLFSCPLSTCQTVHGLFACVCSLQRLHLIRYLSSLLIVFTCAASCLSSSVESSVSGLRLSTMDVGSVNVVRGSGMLESVTRRM